LFMETSNFGELKSPGFGLRNGLAGDRRSD
jgi:hypothetical protein